MKSINAARFKATCLAILDDVARTGERVLVLKRGRPIAEIVPAASRGGHYPQDALAGTVEILDDDLSPVLPADFEVTSRVQPGKRRR
ncbi:MAG TPA: type II toxin-antitoxin system prevent-host-death family antitoxin [Candidatus Bathyarchaeia archaeon]|nr:type II toxin-antitoxin system prevent-host-death family antitoxin [Candidatus Bathyarchaeia archaeon]